MNRLVRPIIYSLSVITVGAGAAVSAAQLEHEPAVGVGMANEYYQEALLTVLAGMGETVVAGSGLDGACLASSTELFIGDGQTEAIGQALSEEGVPGCGSTDEERIRTVNYINRLQSHSEEIQNDFAGAVIRLDDAQSARYSQLDNLRGNLDVFGSSVIGAAAALILTRNRRRISPQGPDDIIGSALPEGAVDDTIKIQGAGASTDVSGSEGVETPPQSPPTTGGVAALAGYLDL